jgi:glycosyltransferase involved in cell wall biosynthesis
MLQAGALQFKPLKKKLFIWLLNMARLPGKLIFHATDNQEKLDIQKAFPAAARIFCIPNFPRGIAEPLKYTEKKPGDVRCVYVSRLAPKKNIYYFLQLLHKLPVTTRVSFVIRGEAEDKGYWQQCEEAIRSLPSHVVARFEGPVQNDVIIPFLQEHHLFVLPTLGENFGHAVFEAFAAGRPVLISDKTPWRGLAAKKGAGMNQEEFNEWCNGARQLAVDFTMQSDLKQQYLKLFN